ncbi:MAG: hypothetical protein HC889_19275 [Synechococcaceae cyanobacterium SM1_2_3]|nr:hypothetical protein [Synechococcaceae cyanobacterium SM1_2_3]
MAGGAEVLGGAAGLALAAPTGKAAARLQEAIRAAKPDLGRLGLQPEQLAQIPEEASTLHRLLGARPDSIYFRHDRDNPLRWMCWWWTRFRWLDWR